MSEEIIDLRVIQAAKNEFISMLDERRRNKFELLLGQRIIDICESKITQCQYIAKWTDDAFALMRKEDA